MSSTHSLYSTNVASSSVLNKILEKNDVDQLNKAKSNIGMILHFNQLSEYLPQEKIAILRQNSVLKMDSKHASAEELAQIPGLQPNAFLLFLVVSAEYLGVGLGIAAFVSFIARSTNKAYTAAHLLYSPVSRLPRTFGVCNRIFNQPFNSSFVVHAAGISRNAALVGCAIQSKEASGTATE